MESVWHRAELADEIIQNNKIFEQIQSIVTDIMSGHIDITTLVENMSGALTNKEPENREKGMLFFTKLLKSLPPDYFSLIQLKFISKFYADRLKDNHRVIPAVLEGYLAIISMKNYNVQFSAEFFIALFKDVVCQSQVRQDRYHIYLIVQKLFEMDTEFMKTLGPDFIFGFISAIDGERDPRNLLFLFNFLPKFIANIPLGHLVSEMFDVISCYYPIDFQPAPDDPAAVTRQELADALMPCLCAHPEFAESCLVLLIEKLDSSLRIAKLDSLKLLAESCKTFNADSYVPFLKALWSSIHRETSHKTDDELKLNGHKTLAALVAKLSTTANTDQTFENFVKGILISMQTSIAECTTVGQFVQATKVLLTTANAAKPACAIITHSMIRASIAFYGFKNSPKLQIASIDFLGDLYQLAQHWKILDVSEIEKLAEEIPQLCLTAVSHQAKEYQVAGFRTLIRVIDVLKTDLVLPFVEILMHNVQKCQDNELLGVSVETVHAIAKKYPELIMHLVVKGKCDIEELTQDKVHLQKRLNLLSNLASIDDFTKVIIEEMLKKITCNDQEACKVVEALNTSMSNTSLYSEEKVTQIECDYGLTESILAWLYKEIESSSQESLSHGFSLVSNTIGSLPADKQITVLSNHTPKILEKCETKEIYFLILESLYSSLHRSVYRDNFPEILCLSLKLCLHSSNETIRLKGCALAAHLLNKAESGPKFDVLYETLRNYLSSCNKNDASLCPRLIVLYGWFTKALIMRGSENYLFWLQKITVVISSPEYCKQGAEAIRLITTDSEYLTSKQHCQVSLLYRQRLYQSFSQLMDKLGEVQPQVKESYLLSWAYVLGRTPKALLDKDIDKICPLVIDSLSYENKDLLLVMLGLLNDFVESSQNVVADSLQTILPRLVSLSKYISCMDVRIKSLQCLFEIAARYRTMLLLPYKQDILIDLAPALDDKKRLVRNMAVKARTRWFLIGAPGEEKE